MGMWQSSLRFSAHELHLFAIYDELRRSGDVKTMLHSDTIKMLNERQDPGDKSDYGDITGADIEFVMQNFSELRKCRSMAVLQPKQPPPKLIVEEEKPEEVERSSPVRKRKRPSSPVSLALSKMRRKGYTCRSRFRGSVPPDGNHVLLTQREHEEWRQTGETTMAFRGEIEYLRRTLGDEVTVSTNEDGRVRICRAIIALEKTPTADISMAQPAPPVMETSSSAPPAATSHASQG